jgi:hypothetical protein
MQLGARSICPEHMLSIVQHQIVTVCSTRISDRCCLQVNSSLHHNCCMYLLQPQSFCPHRISGKPYGLRTSVLDRNTVIAPFVLPVDSLYLQTLQGLHCNCPGFA